MSFKTYKIGDIALLTVFAMLIEFAGIGAVRYIFETDTPTNFVLSLSVPLILIIMIRWNRWSLITAVLVGFVTHLSLNTTGIDQLLIYTIGNLGIGLSLISFRYWTKKRIKNEWGLTSLYYFTGYLGMIFFRSVVAMIFGSHLLNTFLQMVLKGELLSMIIGWVVILIARKQPHLMIDMKTYVLTFHEKDVNRDGS